MDSEPNVGMDKQIMSAIFRPEKNSVKKMRILCDRNKNIINPLNYEHALNLSTDAEESDTVA